MDVRAMDLLKKIEQMVGTHKFLQCVCLGGIGFLMGMLMLPNDPEQVLPEPQNNENNKEEN